MNTLISNGLNIILALFITYLIKNFADWRTKNINDDHEIEENSNLAVGIRRAGLYIGGFVIMSSVLIGESNGFKNDLVDMLAYGIFGYILLMVSRMVTDKIVLRSIDNDTACREGNKSVGLVEFGNYIASALIISGAITGDSAPVLGTSCKVVSMDFVNTLIFFILGQLVLIIGIIIYEWLTPFKWADEIKNDNISAGVMAAGMSISLGVIVKKSLMGPDLEMISDLKAFGLSAIAGMLVLFILIPIIDKIFLPHTTLNTEIKRDKNVAAVVVAQGLTIGFSILIATLI